jgi:predicted nucleic acid-binding protein
LLTALPIAPVTVPIALRVGRIDGESQAKGVRLPVADLLIGVTALELGYSVGTGNLRHFQRIPGLSVMQL